MFCGKCGAQVNEGVVFCSSCGAKIESAPAQPYDGQAQSQPPYAQQPYDSQANGQQPQYGEQYRYQQPSGQEPPKKKSKIALWISIVALIVAIAVVALFIWPGFLTAGGNQGLLSGTTTQTMFVNDSAKVFEEAFSGLDSGTGPKINDQPFEMTGDITVGIMGTTQKETLDMAYDNKTLGYKVDLGGQSVTMLLLGDVLYVQANGETQGIKFNVDTDLSKSMTLGDRFNAILQGILNKNVKSASKVDMRKLAELFVNSIDEKCFKTSGSEKTLTLKKKDIVNLLNTFADKLDKDPELKASVKNMILDLTGKSVDVTKELRYKASTLDSQGTDDSTLTCTLSYDNGVPTKINIMADDGTGNGVSGFEFGYNKKSTGNEITFSVTALGKKEVEGDITFTKKASGLDYKGSFTFGEQTIDLRGGVTWTGNNISGDMTMSLSGQDVMTMEYNETIKVGMPATPVKDDSRFAVDTQNAKIQNIEDLFKMFNSSFSSVPGLGS